jgi:DNA-binding XRE family transcriptional regulator
MRGSIVISDVGGRAMGRILEQVLDELPENERDGVETRAQEILAEVDTLQTLRDHLDVSQAELARALGVSQPAISKTETKPAYSLSLAVLEKYVTALGGRLDVTISLPERPPVRLERLADLMNDADGESSGTSD